MPITLGRNEPCHCRSGKKYKKCHLPKDEEVERKRLAKQVIKPTGDAETAKAQKPETGPEKKGGWFNRLMGKGGSLFRPPGHHKAQGGG